MVSEDIFAVGRHWWGVLSEPTIAGGRTSAGVKVKDTLNEQSWLGLLRRYLLASTILHLVWEIVQMPLYTLWRTGSPREVAFAVVHCTAGDLMIATLAIVAALLLTGTSEWPQIGMIQVIILMIIIGIGYTIYSEWLNTVVRQSWTYAPAMPIIPWLGTGLAPLLQWIVVPLLAMKIARRNE